MTEVLCTISTIPFGHIRETYQGTVRGNDESFQIENVLLENEFAEQSQELDFLRNVLLRLKAISDTHRPEMRGAARRVAAEIIKYAKLVSLGTDDCVCVVISGTLFFDHQTIEEFSAHVPLYVHSMQTDIPMSEAVIAYGAAYSDRNNVLAFFAAGDQKG